jgi:phosphoglycolate phosphatase-like HAD superfamily hydrolase
MAIVKLVSDFDGVWTNQEIEADYVWKFVLNRLFEYTGDKTDVIEKLLHECKKDMDKSPWEYGWFWEGTVSCYYQEDPFSDNNAIFNYIERAATTTTASQFKQAIYKLRQAVKEKGKMTLAELSQDCFMKATSQFKLEGKLKPVATAGNIITELTSRGVEIIVVSNSSTEKIEHLFRKAGHTVTNEKSIVRGRLFARGDAKKFVIDNSYTALPEKFEITDRFKISLRRANYHKILMEERPDYVIGDVFSLDLALPLYLRLNDKQFGNLKVIQKVQPHTPKWVKDYLGSRELKGIAYMVNSIDELPGILLG